MLQPIINWEAVRAIAEIIGACCACCGLVAAAWRILSRIAAAHLKLDQLMALSAFHRRRLRDHENRIIRLEVFSPAPPPGSKSAGVRLPKLAV